MILTTCDAIIIGDRQYIRGEDVPAAAITMLAPEDKDKFFPADQPETKGEPEPKGKKGE